MGVVEHERSISAPECFSDFSRALQLPECYITVYRHKQSLHIAFIKYFEAMKCASARRISLCSDIDTHVRPIILRVIS
jgi:hypothetical protein